MLSSKISDPAPSVGTYGPCVGKRADDSANNESPSAVCYTTGTGSQVVSLLSCYRICSSQRASFDCMTCPLPPRRNGKYYHAT